VWCDVQHGALSQSLAFVTKKSNPTTVRVNAGRPAHTHTPGTGMDQEATNPEIVEISDFDDQGGNGAGPRSVFEVLRVLAKGGEGAWACQFSAGHVTVRRAPGRGVRASFAADGADEANPAALTGLWRGKGAAT
jgi:hypothetical protein